MKSMIEFAKAYRMIQSYATLQEQEFVQISDATGRILAVDVLADADMPPFDRSAMDGYACRKSDLGNISRLEIVETIPAGRKPVKIIREGTCARIMTGAEVPEGADCVVKVEDTRLVSPGLVEILSKGDIRNIRHKAEDLKKGDTVIRRGTLLKSQHAGLLAMTGCIQPMVYARPRVGILSTGSELVEPHEDPGVAGIRNCNGTQLMAQLKTINIQAKDLGIIRDNKEEIKQVIKTAVKDLDVLLLSGGVSMGDYDFVPEVIRELGFDIKIHKIKVRPGKPLLFAVGTDTIKNFVFGLPGNPVSTFVQFEVIIRPFLLKMMGASIVERGIRMMMGEALQMKPLLLRYFMPVRMDGGLVYPLEYHGSGHLASYTQADGILEIPENTGSIKKKELVYVRPI